MSKRIRLPVVKFDPVAAWANVRVNIVDRLMTAADRQAEKMP